MILASFMDKKSADGALSQLKALGLVWDLLLAIAIPTIGLALLGRYLDQRWHTAPAFILIGLVVALVLTVVLVKRKAQQIQNDLKKPPES